ncbi:hypothetical protein BC941DRAFT_412922 [Chlamydoabsidia padenii]|nr:hypothetical protein BC941DRAFT_412922 [Chlamydoabsidia padenii]
MCNVYGNFLVSKEIKKHEKTMLLVTLLCSYCRLVFIHYGWAFFLDCCLWWCMISLCFWYKVINHISSGCRLWLFVGCCILDLCNVARNDVNDKIISNTYLERRRQSRFRTFATEAQQWMARYESLAEFFDYTPVEMVEKLQAVLEGQAFCWYTRLQRTIKKDWVARKGKSLHQNGDDSNPVMTATDELKLIKQEKMTIGELDSFILLQ